MNRPAGPVHREDAEVVIAGDMDSDGDVDLVDFGTFAACFGVSVSSPTGFCPIDQAVGSDLNANGRIDLPDFGIFALNFTG